MKRTICELCKRDVEDVDLSGETRYIEFNKVVVNLNTQKDDVQPFHPTIEACVLCADKAYKAIMRLDYNKEV